MLLRHFVQILPCPVTVLSAKRVPDYFCGAASNMPQGQYVTSAARQIVRGFFMAQVKRAPVKRPLSPHLQVYRWGWAMAASIINRVTGGALAVGSILFTWWLVAMATGPEYFEMVQELAGSIVGRLVLLGLTYALMQHLAGGIRHLIMDMGKMYALGPNTSSARLTFLFSIVMTVVIWVAAYSVLGEL
jgi:succinate dehydrogenase / fumarate reductase cytochrome b subunit